MANAEGVTVAALGDSLTHGYGLPVNEGLVPQLQAWLDERGADIHVLNAGVSGDTTAGGLARVAWTLTPDVDALIVALGANDFLRGIDPDISRANLEGILDVAETAAVPVLLVGMEVSNNYGPDYKARFDAMYPELALEYDLLLYPVFFAGLLVDANATTAREIYFQPDGLHPNAAGVRKIVEDLGPSVIELATQVDQ